jgi:large conductance mechanosensitive channel
MWKEFKDFINQGNVLDLAIAVIIGAAFGKIIGSLVEDILMPVISSIFSVNIPDLKLVLKPAELGADGQELHPAIVFGIGKFIQTIIDFILVAFPVFLIVKSVNKMKRKAPVPPPPGPSSTDALLMEIRDLLKK